MVKEYICEKCGKVFSQKGHFMNHQKRKRPCKPIENKVIEEKVQEKLQELSENGDIEIKNKNLISSNQNSNMDNMDIQDELMNNVIELIKNKGLKYIATELNIANGTVQRWVDNKKVPKSYQFEIKKLCNSDIDYTKFTYKEKDQFFTPTDISEYTINTFKRIIVDCEQARETKDWLKHSRSSYRKVKFKGLRKNISNIFDNRKTDEAKELLNDFFIKPQILLINGSLLNRIAKVLLTASHFGADSLAGTI